MCEVLDYDKLCYLREMFILCNFFTRNLSQEALRCQCMVHDWYKFISMVTINTQPIAYHPWRSNLSLVEVDQSKVINIFFKFQLDFEQFYQNKLVNILKQLILKSITVLKRRFCSTW